MNAAARLIFSASRFDHITPLLRQPHWLKASQRIAFKCAVLVYKCLHGSAPWYPAGQLHVKWRTSSIVGRTRLSTVGDRAFPVAAARISNSLPQHITSAASLLVIRSPLKTHLVTISYAMIHDP